jgi:hypothetical protein
VGALTGAGWLAGCRQSWAACAQALEVAAGAQAQAFCPLWGVQTQCPGSGCCSSQRRAEGGGGFSTLCGLT